MTSAEKKFQRKFNSLREQFIGQLSKKIENLNNLWQTVKNNNYSNDSINAFYLTTHSLIGTSGTFYFDEMSAAARSLEASIRAISMQQQKIAQDKIAEVEQALFTLCNEMLVSPGEIKNRTEANVSRDEENNRILIVDDDIEIISIIEEHLKLNGFIVKTLSHPSELINIVKKFKPSLILMDMVFEEGLLAGAAAIEALRDNNYLTPVIFISVHTDMSSRLNAIRMGAYSYLTKPLDLDFLVSNIRMACDIKPRQPYRVLLVDDDLEILQLHAETLRSDGMSVQTISDPMQTLIEIDKFKPELILLDMHMPECSGLEVAATIRQISELNDVPIIFLSSEQDMSIRMMVIKSGSDDFITKPVNLDYLKRTVQARIEKSRKFLATSDSNKALIAKIIERKRLAEHANKTKSEFISKMSHELRTPLNSILGYAQLLKLDHDGTLTEQQQNNLKHILGSGWHLLNLINDVLDISKIESGYLSLANKEINLNDVIVKSIEMNAKCASDRNITITYSNECDPDATVYADATRLQQVVVNILSNAIKFNVDNGKVDITITNNDDNTYKVIITDTGIGLPENELHKLFTPFHRFGIEKNNIEGSGIGLALSAQLIELMDGEIGAYNNEAAGVSFWFSLQQFHRNEIANTSNDKAEHKIKILHIEENVMELELIRQSLTTHRDVELFTARDAESALHIASQITPDIILLDIELSSMDGLTMLHALRTKKHLKNTPIYALSSKIIATDQQSLKQGEFHCYFNKPYNISELLQSIDKLL